MKANDLHNFSFRRVASGCYHVTYTTEFRGDCWEADINDMALIDATLNAEYAKAADIDWLRKVVRRKGSHYSRDGKKL